MAEEYVTTTTGIGALKQDYLDASLEIACSSIDDLVVLPAVKVINIPQGNSLVASMPLFTRDAAEAHTEGTPLEATEGNIARKSATAAGFAIVYCIEDTLQIASSYNLEDFLAQRAAEALLDYLENLLIADFTNAATSYNGTGVRLTVAGFLAAKVQLAYTNNARGQMRAVLYPTGVQHLVESVTNAAGAIWGNSTLDASILSRGEADGFAGVFCGVPVYSSTHVATSSSDKIGAIFIEGQNSNSPPMLAAIAAMPYTKRTENTHEIATDIAIAMVAGVTEVVDTGRVKIISLAAA